jgi:hypothetical protein
MSRLAVPNLETDIGRSGQVYTEIKKAIGGVPNTSAAIAAHGAAVLESVLAAGPAHSLRQVRRRRDCRQYET